MHRVLPKSVPPGGLASVSGVSPWSPYQPMAEADSSTRGAVGCWPIQSTNWRVSSTRLRHSSSRRAAVQGRSAMGAPARFTTASKGWAALSSSSRCTLRAPLHRRCTLRGSRLQTHSSWPWSCQCWHRAWPIRPVPPVSRMRMGFSLGLGVRGDANGSKKWGSPGQTLAIVGPEAAAVCGLQCVQHGEQVARGIRGGAADLRPAKRC